MGLRVVAMDGDLRGRASSSARWHQVLAERGWVRGGIVAHGEPAGRYREVFTALERLERAEAAEHDVAPSSPLGTRELRAAGQFALIVLIVGFFGALWVAAWPLVERVGVAAARVTVVTAALSPVVVLASGAAWRSRRTAARRAEASVAAQRARAAMDDAIVAVTDAPFVLRCADSLAVCDTVSAGLRAQVARAPTPTAVAAAVARVARHEAAVARTLRQVQADGRSRWVGETSADDLPHGEAVELDLLGVAPIPYDPSSPQ